MNAEIFYFSGTGNSLCVARDLARSINGKAVSIASAITKEIIKTDADTIGIVFPAYFGAVLGGIPLIIRKFVGRLESIGSKYIFAVATYGLGRPDFNVLTETIQSHGGNIAAGFAVKMPFYYLYLSGHGALTMKKRQTMFDNWNKKLEVIVDFVSARKEGKFENPGLLFRLLVPPGKLYYAHVLKKLTQMKLPLPEHIKWMDSKFSPDDTCDACGVCSTICPVNNIDMAVGKPVWLHNCEHCCACIQWCPSGAIRFSGKTSEGKRDHHPDVTLNDVLRQNRGSA